MPYRPYCLKNEYHLSKNRLIKYRYYYQKQKDFEEKYSDINEFSLNHLEYYDYVISQLTYEINRRNELGLN